MCCQSAGTLTIPLSGWPAPEHEGGVLYLEKGNVELDGLIASASKAQVGGAVYTESGTSLTTTNATFTKNVADMGATLCNDRVVTQAKTTVNVNTGIRTGPNKGGALENFGTLNVWNSTIHDNDATGSGACITNGGMLAMVDCTITGNSSADDGNGLCKFYDDATTLTN